MKTLHTIILFAISLVAYTQDAKPYKEFSVTLSQDTVSLLPGESKTIDVNVVKAKAYQKGKLKMGISSTLPTGILVAFEPETNQGDLIKLKLKAEPGTTSGIYSIIINATINYKTKGTILKITVP